MKRSCGRIPQKLEGGAIDENHYSSIHTPGLMPKYASRQRDDIRPHQCGDAAKPCDCRGALH
jgi:hypothetical protein